MKIAVHITPNASRNQVQGRNENGEYRIKVQSPPMDGAANKCLMKYLSKLLGISKSGISIVRGETSRHKVMEIQGQESSVHKLMEGEYER